MGSSQTRTTIVEKRPFEAVPRWDELFRGFGGVNGGGRSTGGSNAVYILKEMLGTLLHLEKAVRVPCLRANIRHHKTLYGKVHAPQTFDHPPFCSGIRTL